MGAALTDLQAGLLKAKCAGDTDAFLRLSTRLDAFSQVTFIPPMEGYIRRMLWALAAEGVIPDDACDDPWGPALPPAQREAVRRALREARVR
jgi:4-hydroxy-tetrahydrodipicolinate synthase